MQIKELEGGQTCDVEEGKLKVKIVGSAFQAGFRYFGMEV